MGVEEDIKVLDESLKNLRRKYRFAKSEGNHYDMREYQDLISIFKDYKISLVKKPYNMLVVKGKEDFEFIDGGIRKEVLPDNYKVQKGVW